MRSPKFCLIEGPQSPIMSSFERSTYKIFFSFGCSFPPKIINFRTGWKKTSFCALIKKRNFLFSKKMLYMQLIGRKKTDLLVRGRNLEFHFFVSQFFPFKSNVMAISRKLSFKGKNSLRFNMGVNFSAFNFGAWRFWRGILCMQRRVAQPKKKRPSICAAIRNFSYRLPQHL